jgi:hypothetical protein
MSLVLLNAHNFFVISHYEESRNLTPEISKTAFLPLRESRFGNGQRYTSVTGVANVTISI